MNSSNFTFEIDKLRNNISRNFMWVCPKCKRSFKTKNQSHSCVIIDIEALFENKPPLIKEMYRELLRRCEVFARIEIDITISCLYFVENQRFLVIKPKKNGIILELVLNRTIDAFPIIKTQQIGKFKYVHRVQIDRFEDVNNELISWIKEAYNLKK